MGLFSDAFCDVDPPVRRRKRPQTPLVIDEWQTIDSVKEEGYNVYTLENSQILDAELEGQFLKLFPGPKALEYDGTTTLTLVRGGEPEKSLREMIAPLDAVATVECLGKNNRHILGISYR